METASAASSEDEAAAAKFLQLSVSDLQKRGSEGSGAAASEANSECNLEEQDLVPKAAQVCHNSSISSGGSGAPSISSTNDSAVMGQSDSHAGVDSKGIGIGPPLDDSRVSFDLEATEDNFRKLQDELVALKSALRERDKEVVKLSRLREDLEAEMEDLTASLFEEAHKMVRDAMVKQVSAEKVSVEANMKIEGLETEVAALKTLVLTSTPSQPNKHLHPQIDPKNNKRPSSGKKTKDTVDAAASSPRSLKNGRLGGLGGSNSSLNSPQSSLVLVNSGAQSASSSLSSSNGSSSGEEQAPMKYIDPALRKEYLSWKKCPTLDRKESAFMERIYAEDIDRCLEFSNETAAAAVSRAVHSNSLCINPVTDFSNVPRDCTLLQSPLLCRFHLKFDASDEGVGEEGFYISQLSRNRVAAVIDCLNYLRYIKQGLVKSHVNDVYWEIMHLRSKMTLARFGYMAD